MVHLRNSWQPSLCFRGPDPREPLPEAFDRANRVRALVRSRIRSRSIEPSAPMRVRDRARPPEVVVSICLGERAQAQGASRSGRPVSIGSPANGARRRPADHRKVDGYATRNDNNDQNKAAERRPTRRGP